ncbi:hypothetical protein PIB30_061731 [Stylosanthes scabra]|uniref:Uncharacterized protein n=1 Tax=Stylosanthes scabra TaxID=79078 RepID=A0ABU6ZJL2_9FABA|nr:hypothetical protein [Stylosanthes scabra]
MSGKKKLKTGSVEPPQSTLFFSPRATWRNPSLLFSEPPHPQTERRQPPSPFSFVAVLVFAIHCVQPQPFTLSHYGSRHCLRRPFAITAVTGSNAFFWCLTKW